MDDIFHAYNPWWENTGFDSGVPRTEYLERSRTTFKRKQIGVIIGSRRVGKTTFLKQLIRGCLDENIHPESILYLALDHPRISKIPISEHLTYFRKMFSHSRSRKLYLFLDEVQDSPAWEAELKGIYDLENVKIVITSSTSALIKSQGGKLTGRQLVNTVYPLSFSEYLTFLQAFPLKSESYKYEKLFETYLNTGGYPENVLNPSDEYLNNLLEDIIARDIIKLHNIRNPNLLKDLFMLIVASLGSRISFNKLANTLGVSVDTAKEYTSHLETAFLVRTMGKWTDSAKERIYAQKKIYLYDTGFKNLITGPGDMGAKVENEIYMSLFKNGKKCGYYAESEKEINFVYGNRRNPEAVESKYITAFDWKDKRFSGIRLFLKRYPETSAVNIISKNVEKKIRKGKTRINIIPAWKYLK